MRAEEGRVAQIHRFRKCQIDESEVKLAESIITS